LLESSGLAPFLAGTASRMTTVSARALPEVAGKKRSGRRRKSDRIHATTIATIHPIMRGYALDADATGFVVVSQDGRERDAQNVAAGNVGSPATPDPAIVCLNDPFCGSQNSILAHPVAYPFHTLLPTLTMQSRTSEAKIRAERRATGGSTGIGASDQDQGPGGHFPLEARPPPGC
jgi:hypothetical protein